MDAENNHDNNYSSVAEEEDIKLTTVVEGGETVIPTSNVRSSLAQAAVKKETSENVDEAPKSKSPGRVRKTMENEEVASQPSTPKRARTKSNSPSAKDVLKTPTKKEASSTPTTPRESAPLASVSLAKKLLFEVVDEEARTDTRQAVLRSGWHQAWQPEHWNDLNFAILKVAHDHVSTRIRWRSNPGLSPVPSASV